MNGEIICVGTELLLGNIVNTNAQYLSQGLAELGINMYNQSVVGDNPARLRTAIREAMERSDIVILTGGLGPTADDITKETVASLLGVELIVREDVLHKLEEYYARQGRVMPRGVEKQALIPEGAEMFHNEVGTAPGFAIEKNGCKIITIPGPPKEMKTMFDGYVKPYLKGVSGRSILSSDLHIYGMGESEVANLLGALLDGSNPTAATYAKTGEVVVRVTASDETEDSALLKREEHIRKIADKLGSYLYLVGEGDLSFVAVETLKAKGLKVATAESCTAGMVSKSLTDISGSSAVFEMGVSAYANDIKRKVLGVPDEILEEFGAVSAETAAIMAKGVRSISGADIGIGITGVAGPEPSEGKPVGLVYVGMTDGESVWIRELNAAFHNDREKVRAYATLAALDLIRRYATAYPRTLGGGAKSGDNIKILHGAGDFTLPQGTSIMGLTPLSQVMALEEAVRQAEAEKNAEKEAAIAPDPEELEAMDGMEMIGFVPDPDSHIGYEDIAVDAAGYITDEESESPEEKQPLMKRIIKYLLPWKGDTKSEIIRKIVFLVALIVFIVAGTYLLSYMAQGGVNKNLVDHAREVYTKAEEGTDDNGMLLSFKGLYEQNPDVVGWINIAGTKIDYPVYQTDNNDFYITHDMSRAESRYGAIFTDCNASISTKGNSKNLVLYGHNMIDDSMFGSLLEYTNLNYYRENPVIDFDTLYGQGEYKIFAVFITNALKEQDDGYVFNYRQNTFGSDSNFLNWIENVKVRSLINTDVDVIATDEILTLSTCSYEFEEARTVVMARKIRDGESRHTDTLAARKNKTPLYPQAYYDKNGGKKPEINLEQQSNEAVEPTATSVEGFKAQGEKAVISQEDIDAVKDKNAEAVEFVEVENFVGLSLTAAVREINESGLYINNIEYTGANENLSTVLRQSLKKGSEVAVGNGINLTVSGNKEGIIVPQFVGKSLKKAKKLADETGLTLSIVRCASGEKKDTVVMQSAEPESKTADRYLVLYVSGGINRVPSVISNPQADAEESLKNQGFEVKIKKVAATDFSEVGKVVKQSVDGGEYLELGETVTIHVGKKEKSKETSSKATSSENSSDADEINNTDSEDSSSETEDSSSDTDSEEDTTSSNASPTESDTDTSEESDGAELEIDLQESDE